MGRLRKDEIGNAAGIYNLVRNIGGSIGIASVTTLLVRNAQVHQNYLVANIATLNPTAAALLKGLETQLRLTGLDAYTAHRTALAEIYGMVQQQASLLAYVDDFRLLGFLSLLCIPIALCFRGVPKHPQTPNPSATD